MSQRVLCLAPHPDDESLGVGGTLARHAAEGDQVSVVVLTGPGPDRPHPLVAQEVFDDVRAGTAAAMKVLGIDDLTYEDLPAAMVGDIPGHEVNRVIASVVDRVRPDVVYVPFPYDVHIDHRAVFHAAALAWRPVTPAGLGIQRVLAYETASETNWGPPYLEPGFQPNHFVDISAHLATKLDALRCYTSQMRPFPATRSIEAVEAQARWRGSLVGMEAAEAFVTIRDVRRAP